ncbi:hypothetical protein MFUL124B02_42210 [Myxococcus fulvus 124B02]|nr:hypothetical protein MFUL124B02_42210 [Myxococcus fulvus 124B02]
MGHDVVRDDHAHLVALHDVEKALDSGKFDAVIAEDSREGTRVGAGGTPTFFINGRPILGAVPVDQFRRVIDEELKKAGVATR